MAIANFYLGILGESQSDFGLKRGRCHLVSCPDPPTKTSLESEEKETTQHLIWMLNLSCEAVQDRLLQRISPVLVDYEQ